MKSGAIRLNAHEASILYGALQESKCSEDDRQCVARLTQKLGNILRIARLRAGIAPTRRRKMPRKVTCIDPFHNVELLEPRASDPVFRQPKSR